MVYLLVVQQKIQWVLYSKSLYTICEKHKKLDYQGFLAADCVEYWKFDLLFYKTVQDGCSANYKWLRTVNWTVFYFEGLRKSVYCVYS